MKDNTSIIRWSIILGSFIIISSILWNTYIFFQNFKSEERIKNSLPQYENHEWEVFSYLFETKEKNQT